MKYGNEIIMLVFNLVVLIFVLIYYREFKQIKGFKVLFLSFLLFCIASFCTNMEGFFLERILNVLEHILYAASIIVLLLWLYGFMISKKNLT